MRSAGFVLVGGKSSRMGEDKALLPYRGGTLGQHVASTVAGVAGSVTLIGSPESYKHLGYPVSPDLRPGNGPLAGIEAALSLEQAEWNLIVACDLPLVSAPILSGLLAAADSPEVDVVLPVTDGQPQPLAAVWNVRMLSRVRSALDDNQRKVLKVVEKCRIVSWPVPGAGFENMNTPEEWRAFLHG